MSEIDQDDPHAAVRAALSVPCPDCGHDVDDHGSDLAGCYLCADLVADDPGNRLCPVSFMDLVAERLADLVEQAEHRGEARVREAVESVLQANERRNAMVETIQLRRRVRKALDATTPGGAS